MWGRRFFSGLVLACGLFVGACASLVASYDATFDQSLNKLSEDTAKFLASASAGGPEASFGSKETTTYYAATYNLLDRLSDRARLSRGVVPCPTDATLKIYASKRTSRSALPDDYQSFDCREFQLYAVRFFVDQLYYVHSGGTLNRSQIRLMGRELQTSIMGAIQTFVVNKPSA